MQNPKLDDKGEADEGERVKAYQEEGRPRRGSMSWRYMLRGCTDHLFLCPKKALGRPVRMRTEPRTPKAGSILVSRMVAEAADALALGVGVGAIVMVTSKVVGKMLTTARVCVPVLKMEVVAKELVSLITVTLGVGVGVVDWAAVESMREAYKRRGRTTSEGKMRASQGIRGGGMMVDGRRRATGTVGVWVEAKSEACVQNVR
jgi:hypothetical protein